MRKTRQGRRTSEESPLRASHLHRSSEKAVVAIGNRSPSGLKYTNLQAQYVSTTNIGLPQTENKTPLDGMLDKRTSIEKPRQGNMLLEVVDNPLSAGGLPSSPKSTAIQRLRGLLEGFRAVNTSSSPKNTMNNSKTAHGSPDLSRTAKFKILTSGSSQHIEFGRGVKRQGSGSRDDRVSPTGIQNFKEKFLKFESKTGPLQIIIGQSSSKQMPLEGLKLTPKKSTSNKNFFISRKIEQPGLAHRSSITSKEKESFQHSLHGSRKASEINLMIPDASLLETPLASILVKEELVLEPEIPHVLLESASTSSFEKRICFNLKKNNGFYQSINKKLKDSSDNLRDTQKSSLKVNLRGAIQAAKMQSVDLDDLAIGDLDSSVEADDQKPQEKLLSAKKTSKVGDYRSMNKKTESSSAQISNIEGGLGTKSPPRSFFDESLGHSKKEAGGSLSNQGSISQQKIRASASSYYFKNLYDYLGDSSPAEKGSRRELYLDHYELMAKSFQLARQVVRPPESFLVQKLVYLPPNVLSNLCLTEEKKTLILDLDETLVHCNDTLEEPFDHLINIKFADGEIVDAGINVRPGLKSFFERMNVIYEIVIFTASQSYYANEVLNLIDPSNEFVTFRLYKDHCFHTPAGHMLKDLRLIKNREPQNIVIVDNATYSYSLQLENGVPIVPFFNDRQDKELAKLAAYLEDLASCQDVRESIAADFKLDLFRKYCFNHSLLRDNLLTASAHS